MSCSDTKESFGGTWRQHTYPGIRSDSDLYTFGYGFKPWTGKPIASGEAILEYLEEVIDDDHIDRHIRYQHEVLTRILVRRRPTVADYARGARTPARILQFTCNFLWMCQGYYRHSAGLHAQVGGYGGFQGARSSTRRPGRKTSTTQASGWW